MDFTEEMVNHVRVFRLQGKIMGDEKTQLMCARLKEMSAAGSQRLVMDFREVNWINSSGIGAIIACLTALRQHGGDLRFANVHHKSQYYFHLTKLETIVQMFGSVEAAVASFAAHESAGMP